MKPFAIVPHQSVAFSKTLLLISSVLLVLIVTSCAPAMRGVWKQDSYTGNQYQKLAIVAISPNVENRTIFEQEAVKQFRKKGVQAVAGIDYFPPKMTEAERSPENLLKIVRDNQLDGVITISLVKKEESMSYVPGGKTMVPTTYSRYGPFVYQRYTAIDNPGYYTSSKSYLIEAVLHDLHGEIDPERKNLVWTGQSKLVDPTSVPTAAKQFSRAMVGYLVKEELVK